MSETHACSSDELFAIQCKADFEIEPYHATNDHGMHINPSLTSTQNPTTSCGLEA